MAAARSALSWHQGTATHSLIHTDGKRNSSRPSQSFCLDWHLESPGSMKRAHPDYSSSDSELDEPIEVEKESADENG